MAPRGRPRIFVTRADKQKAYRDRKKRDSALRNSFDRQTSPVAPDHELEVLWIKTEEIERSHAELVANFYALTVTRDGFDDWNRRIRELADQWSAAHQIWYAAWKVMRYPAGPWTK